MKNECALLGSLPPAVDERISELHAYWESIRPSAAELPGRQHFDPVDIPRLLPYLWLVDVHHDPVRFRYRLSGTEIVRAMGADNNGRFLDEIHANFSETTTCKQYMEVLRTGLFAYREGPPTRKNEEHRWIQRLLLPLARDGKSVDMILGMGIYPELPKGSVS